MIYVLLSYFFRPFIFFRSRARRNGGSILVFQTAKIGDMINTSPVFREIKKAYPMTRLGVVIEPATRGLLRHNPHIDEVIEYDREKYSGFGGKLAFARMIREKKYSVALVLMPNVANLFIALFAHIPKRVSVFPDYMGRTLRCMLRSATHLEYHYTPRLARDTYLHALRHLDIIKFNSAKEVWANPDAEAKARELIKIGGPYIGIVMGTGNSLKDWGQEKFRKVALLVASDTRYNILFIGSEKDRPVAEGIMTYLNSGRAQNLCGLFDLTEAPALTRRLALAVGVDTGMMYMADSQDVPTVIIAGPCDMEDQRPTFRPYIVQEKGRLECVPCSHTYLTPYKCRFGHRLCVTQISAEEVFKVIKKALPEAK